MAEWDALSDLSGDDQPEQGQEKDASGHLESFNRGSTDEAPGNREKEAKAHDDDQDLKLGSIYQAALDDAYVFVAWFLGAPPAVLIQGTRWIKAIPMLALLFYGFIWCGQSPPKQQLAVEPTPIHPMVRQYISVLAAAEPTPIHPIVRSYMSPMVRSYMSVLEAAYTATPAPPAEASASEKVVYITFHHTTTVTATSTDPATTAPAPTASVPSPQPEGHWEECPIDALCRFVSGWKKCTPQARCWSKTVKEISHGHTFELGISEDNGVVCVWKTGEWTKDMVVPSEFGKVGIRSVRVVQHVG
ncbi:hypothetical protein BU16DRAFT_543694 [Lophium mytilinum]|uniref:Uncharacterized protein n=1 Tax=Lophium mytilinum TaxID=390894 RepID=A0A6A6QDY7_9PEZI|nr:hypothetical protein BU16DRAFT_543694 [Lophium mytilinum]